MTLRIWYGPKPISSPPAYRPNAATKVWNIVCDLPLLPPGCQSSYTLRAPMLHLPPPPLLPNHSPILFQASRGPIPRTVTVRRNSEEGDCELIVCAGPPIYSVVRYPAVGLDHGSAPSGPVFSLVPPLQSRLKTRRDSPWWVLLFVCLGVFGCFWVVGLVF